MLCHSTPIIDPEMRPQSFFIDIRFLIAIWRTASQPVHQPEQSATVKT